MTPQTLRWNRYRNQTGHFLLDSKVLYNKHHIFNIINFYFYITDALPTCLSVHVRHLKRPEEAIRSLGTGITDSCDLHVGAWNRPQLLYKNTQCL